MKSVTLTVVLLSAVVLSSCTTPRAQAFYENCVAANVQSDAAIERSLAGLRDLAIKRRVPADAAARNLQEWRALAEEVREIETANCRMAANEVNARAWQGFGQGLSITGAHGAAMQQSFQPPPRPVICNTIGQTTVCH